MLQLERLGELLEELQAALQAELQAELQVELPAVLLEELQAAHQLFRKSVLTEVEKRAPWELAVFPEQVLELPPELGREWPVVLTEWVLIDDRCSSNLSSLPWIRRG